MFDIKPPPTQRNIYVPAERLALWRCVEMVARELHKSQSEFVHDALAHELSRYPQLIDQTEGRASRI